MDRRKFLRNGALVTAVAGILPLGLSAESRIKVLTLPTEQPQVRHGDWAPAIALSHPDLRQSWSYQRHRFFANGCAASGADLGYIALVNGQANLSFTMQHGAVTCRSKHAELCLSEWESERAAEMGGAHVTLASLAHGWSLPTAGSAGALVLVLDGDARKGWNVVDQTLALVVPAGESLELPASSGIVAVIN